MIPLSLRLVGLHILTQQEEDEIVVKKGEDVDIDATLLKLAEYAARKYKGVADVIVLVTGRFGYSFKHGDKRHLMGLAYQGYVCTDYYFVIVVEDLGAQFQISATLPHEIGHQLGSPHDGSENRKHPGCPRKGWIMAAHIDGYSGDQFSTCSLESIMDLLNGMTDSAYLQCINVKNRTADFLTVQQHLPPPTYTAEKFCRFTEGANYYSWSFADCVISCYFGGFMEGYPHHDFPAPYGFRCGKGMICLYGACQSCDKYQPQWDNCKNL